MYRDNINGEPIPIPGSKWGLVLSLVRLDEKPGKVALDLDMGVISFPLDVPLTDWPIVIRRCLLILMTSDRERLPSDENVKFREDFEAAKAKILGNGGEQ
ncbi:MAG: hypothetical protein ACM359_12165 [Bacillota bacterium]